MFTEEFFPFGFTLILIIALALLAVVHKALRDRNRIRLLEMIHQERIAAMKSNQPLPDPPIATLEENGDPGSWVPSFETSLYWVRLTALALGLFGIFTGLGMIVSFLVVGDPEFNRMWAIGFLPIFAGVGLLLFHRLSDGTTRRPASGSATQQDRG